MSAIRVTEGTASVELESYGLAYADGAGSVRYRTADLMATVVRVLKAADTSEADDWASAIRSSAASRGLAL